MDSKNIFIASTALIDKAEWKKQSDNSEWYYIGEDEDFDLKKVQEKVSSFLKEETIYLVTDRHSSREIETNLSARKVQKALKDFSEVTLCSKDFKDFMTFNRIGVAKQGRYFNEQD
ncbi:MAG: hypothetical protein ACMZ7B_13010 [Balneola sp.]